MKLVYMGLILMVSFESHARKGEALPAEAKAVEKRIEEIRAGAKTGTQETVSRVGKANTGADFKAKSSELSAVCKGDCTLPQALEKVAHTGESMQLSAKAMNNAAQATARAAELVQTTGMTPQAAEAKALAELGLNSEKVRSDCK